MLLSVVWDVDPAIFSIGSLEVRYYGLTWAFTFLVGLWFFHNFIKREGLSPKLLDSLFWFGILSTIIGSRLGHCLFYDPEYYLSHPLEILNLRKGGLASHGAALGLLTGLWLFSRYKKMPYIWSLDRIMFPVTLGGAAVRLGNLMNSEIYGMETDLPWGFIFVRAGETMPKHPTQIYEALCYIITFLILVWLYYHKNAGQRRPGILFGVGLIGVFLSRFFIEFIKNPQESFEEGWTLDMGQWLSIPFVILGVWIIVRALRRPPVEPAEAKAGQRSAESKAAAAANVKSASSSPAKTDAKSAAKGKKK